MRVQKKRDDNRLRGVGCDVSQHFRKVMRQMATRSFVLETFDKLGDLAQNTSSPFAHVLLLMFYDIERL